MRLALGLAFPFLPAPWRLPVAVIAAVSDLADGTASRLLRARTELGRVLDPVADKVFVIAVLVTLLAENTLGLGEVLLIGVRDIVIGLGGAWLLLTGGRAALRHLEPSWLGKAATAAQVIFLLSVLAFGQRLMPLFLAAAVLSIVAALDYLRRFVTQRAGGGPVQERQSSSHKAL